MDLIKFSPTEEKLNAIVAQSSQITAVDLADDTQLATVKQTRIELRDARIVIEKAGKSMREEALKYQRDVIAEEKRLIGIIDPEEKRLKAIEEEAALIKERAARIALLPMRKEQLLPLGVPFTDEQLLDMDNDEFIVYLNNETTAKNERDRQEIEAEKARLAHEAELAAAAENARVAERNRIETVAKADEERRIQAEAQKKYDAELAAQKLIDDAKFVAAQKAAEAQKIVDDAKAEALRIATSSAAVASDDIPQVDKPSRSLAEDALSLRNRIEVIEGESASRALTYIDLLLPLLDELDELI